MIAWIPRWFLAENHPSKFSVQEKKKAGHDHRREMGVSQKIWHNWKMASTEDFGTSLSILKPTAKLSGIKDKTILQKYRQSRNDTQKHRRQFHWPFQFRINKFCTQCLNFHCATNHTVQRTTMMKISFNGCRVSIVAVSLCMRSPTRHKRGKSYLNWWKLCHNMALKRPHQTTISGRKNSFGRRQQQQLATIGDHETHHSNKQVLCKHHCSQRFYGRCNNNKKRFKLSAVQFVLELIRCFVRWIVLVRSFS